MDWRIEVRLGKDCPYTARKTAARMGRKAKLGCMACWLVGKKSRIRTLFKGVSRKVVYDVNLKSVYEEL